MRQGQMVNHQYSDFGVAVSTAATSALNYDTLGFDYAVVNVVHEPATNSSSNAKWLSLRLMHGITTDPTNFTAITGATGTTNATTAAGEFILPVHNDTTLGGVVSFFVQLVGKERFLRVEKKAAASHAFTTNHVMLSQADNVPDSAATRGSNKDVFV